MPNSKKVSAAVKFLSQSLRCLYITYIIFRFGLNEFMPQVPLLHYVRFLRFLNPAFWSYRTMSRGVRIRRALEKLGPIFVKFGQILSTRRDLLPEDIADELAKLQDQVPPFPGKYAIKTLEKAFKKPLAQIYKTFDSVPLASASIAQVHAATLPSGESVIVKLLRPKVKIIIEKDLAWLMLFARLIELVWSEGKRLRPKAIVKEFETTLYYELDLLREAANASQLQRNFLNSPLLYIPSVYWDYCKQNVLTMERIDAIPVDDLKTLRAEGVDLKKLSERGVEIFFTQVFRDNFFHADMHPGNIFVEKNNPHSPRYVGVDFGIMGCLSEDDKRYLAENLLAFFNRDYARVAKLHIESGWIPKDTRAEQFEGAIRTVCEPIFQKPLKDISFGELLVRLFQIASQFKMPIQPQLILLEKTLLNVEGLGRTLNPELDLWQTAKPFLENWIKQQVGVKAFLKRLRAHAPDWIETIPELPRLLTQCLQQPKITAVPPRQLSKRSFIYGLSGGFILSALLLILFTTQLIFAILFLALGMIIFLIGYWGGFLWI